MQKSREASLLLFFLNLECVDLCCVLFLCVCSVRVFCALHETSSAGYMFAQFSRGFLLCPLCAEDIVRLSSLAALCRRHCQAGEFATLTVMLSSGFSLTCSGMPVFTREQQLQLVGDGEWQLLSQGMHEGCLWRMEGRFLPGVNPRQCYRDGVRCCLSSLSLSDSSLLLCRPLAFWRSSSSATMCRFRHVKLSTKVANASPYVAVSSGSQEPVSCGSQTLGLASGSFWPRRFSQHQMATSRRYGLSVRRAFQCCNFMRSKNCSDHLHPMEQHMHVVQKMWHCLSFVAISLCGMM